MRNIDTYGRFIIDEAQCDICAGVYHDTVFAEIEKRHPEWRDSPGVVKKEYHKTWNAAYDDSPERMCFVFEADCHGDAISLCDISNVEEGLGVRSKSMMLRPLPSIMCHPR